MIYKYQKYTNKQLLYFLLKYTFENDHENDTKWSISFVLKASANKMQSAYFKKKIDCERSAEVDVGVFKMQTRRLLFFLPTPYYLITLYSMGPFC